MKLGFDPHILGVMFDCSPLPVVKVCWVVEFGHINGQGSRESIDEHINDHLVGQTISSEAGESFKRTDVIVEPVIPFHFEGFDISLGVDFSSNICERPEEGIQDCVSQIFMVVISYCLSHVIHGPSQLFLCPFLDLIPLDEGKKHEDPRERVDHLWGETIDASIYVPFLYERL